MKLPVVLRDDARQEFNEAFDWYNAQRAGLGLEFIAEVEAELDRISTMPTIRPEVMAGVRKGVVRRFPYCIFYRPQDVRVEVIAIFHGKRDPSVWRSRI